MTLAAAAAGKHVLCEKPIAMTADEAAQLREAAGRVLIAEAFMVRFHPQWLRARELVREGRIGTLRVVQMFFGYNNVDPNNVRNKADIGGGGALRHRLLRDRRRALVLRGRAVARHRADRSRSDVPHRPRSPARCVEFSDGRRLDFTVSTQIAPHQRIQLVRHQGPHRDRDPGQRAAGREDAHPRSTTARRSKGPASRPRRCPRATSTSCRARVLARGARRDRAAVRRRRRDRQHARDRRAVPLREERAVGADRA